MNDTPDRKSKIVEILNSRQIRTQEELLEILRKDGIAVTQATLSRDMRSLGAVKVHDIEEGFHYRIPSVKKDPSGHNFIKVEASGQCCVVKTRPGYASAIASMIDNSSLDGVMGTIAGDDTILLILRLGADTEQLIKSLKTLQ